MQPTVDDSQAVKERTAAHWSANPIASRHVDFHPVHEEFSRGWFEEHARFRYEEYGPWMREVAGFDRHAGELMLEVGCGMGTDLLEFARGGARVVGVDITPRHLELAARRFSLFGRRAALHRGDAERLPFRDESFDFVYSNGVLHHTPDTAGAVREIHRVLKPGGTATVLLYHRGSVYYRYQICLLWGTKAILKRLLGRGGWIWDFRWRDHVAHSTDGDSNPLTTLYTESECRALFDRFSSITTRIVHLNPADFPILRRLSPAKRAALERRWGWYVVIDARR